MVGVNEYRVDDDELTAIHRIDPDVERQQRERRRRHHAAAATRRRSRARSTALRHAAATDANLMPPLIECARARATEGEMVATLQDVFGTYTETPVF